MSFETKSVYKVSGTLSEELKNAAMYVIDENGESYFAENAVSGDTFEIYLSDGTYLLAFTGETREGVITTEVRGAAAENLRLEITYAKVTVATPGGKGTEAGTRGTWTKTANGEYTVEGLHDGNAFTIAQLGKSENFIVSAKIKGGSGMQAGFTLLTGGWTQNFRRRTQIHHVFMGRKLDEKRLSGYVGCVRRERLYHDADKIRE